MITFRAVYYNVDDAAYEAVPSAEYTLDGCTKSGFEIVCGSDEWYHIATSYTDASGYFYLEGCSGVDAYLAGLYTRSLGSGDFRVGSASFGQGGQVASDCGGNFDIYVTSTEARVFINTFNSVAGSTSLFGVTRSFITINVATCNDSYYSSSSDQITICTVDVWGEWGKFITGHEYGHAFHQDALSGNMGGNCPSPHFLDTESNLTCAFSEGFANYFGAAVRPDLTSFSYRGYMDNDAYFPGCVQRQSTSPYTCTGGTSYEGSVIEAAYAAFLYNLTDASTEPHDSIAAPGSYVRDLIRTCQALYSGSSWRRANGPDEVAYCAEDAVNPGSYFTRRGAYPTSYSESATKSSDWTTARVHSMWTWNMYQKR